MAKHERRFVLPVDIFPSVLFALEPRRPIPAGIQGVNLFSAAAQKPPLAEFWDERERRFVRAIYENNLKLIRAGDEPIGLYDLAKDPQEITNLVRSQPDDVARLTREIERFLPPLKQSEPPPAEKKRKAVERLLKSLGYLK